LLDDPERDGTMSLSERIEHVRFTLADMCLEKNADRFSFFRLLNRVIFLFQKPLIFAICRKSDETHGYIVDRYTHGDPFYLDQFKAALRRLGMQPDFSDVPEKAIGDCCINRPSPFLYRNPLISCSKTKQLVNECNLSSYA